MKHDFKRELALELLRQHGRCRLQVSGTSMLPTLWPGDVVSIESRPAQDLCIGDIVLYERCGRFFLHRLVALPEQRFPDRLITRGDSMPKADPAVRTECVLGVVGSVCRRNDAIEDWIGIPKSTKLTSRMAGAALARSSLLVRVLLRTRSSVLARARNREVPSS